MGKRSKFTLQKDRVLATLFLFALQEKRDAAHADGVNEDVAKGSLAPRHKQLMPFVRNPVQQGKNEGKLEDLR